MDFSERNKKVAIARWKNAHSKQRSQILEGKDAILMKAAICGFLAGDGSVQKRKEKNYYHYQIDFYPDDNIMERVYISQIEKVYNKTPLTRKDKGFSNVRFSSKVIYEDITKFSRFGLKNWTIPKKLFNIKGTKENWLKAFFSAEAYVNDKVIRVQTVNKEGMKEVSKLLKELGIDNNYYEYNSKKI